LVLISLLSAKELYSQNDGSYFCDVNKIVPVCPSNPLQKTGYYVLLDQTFQNPSKYWTKSKYGDDKGCDFDFMRNQQNVTFPCYPGQAGDTTQTCFAYLWNTNVQLMSGCNYSMGEIKTMTVDAANDTFKSYYFYGSGYIEAKVKQAYAQKGQGSSMWLWSMLDSDDPSIVHPNILDNNEIDVFETQPNSSYIFNTTYHWRMEAGLQQVENAGKIYLRNEDFSKYDYTTNWTVFAVEWNAQSISWFVNNVMVYTMDMGGTPSGCTIGSPDHYFPPIGPFCIRFNSGPNTVGSHDPVEPGTLPVHMEIEYVRVYKADGEKAAPITIFSGSANQICSTENSFESSNTILSANYYPDAAYDWSSPAFEIQPYDKPGHAPQHHNGKVKVWVNPGIQGDTVYPIYLTTTLPYHSEKDTIYYFLAGSAPPLPQNDFEAVPGDAPGCLYEISKPVNSSSTISCEYFDYETGLWKEATIKKINDQRIAFFGSYEPYTRVLIQYREKNSCGYSEIRYASLTTPVPVPGSCRW